MIMRLSIIYPAFLLVLLHSQQCFVTAASTGSVFGGPPQQDDPQQRRKQLRNLQQSCFSPGQSCLDQLGFSRGPCCRGPDACPADGICPGGQGSTDIVTTDSVNLITTTPPLITTTPSEQQQTSSGVYEFAVLGDVPYSPYELCGIPYELNKMPRNAKFLIHLGDLLDGKEGDCAAYRYTNVANAFRNSPIAVHFIFGENEFNQCKSNCGLYYEELKEWKKLPVAQKTYLLFQSHVKKAQKEKLGRINNWSAADCSPMETVPLDQQ
jgi:hypothetical protein